MLDLKSKIIGVLTIGMLILIFFIQRGCDAPETITKQKVTIPEKKGSFKEPIAIINHKGRKDSIAYEKGKTIYTKNPFNKKLAEDFLKAQKANDSLKVLNLYLSSIQEKEQTHVFDNKDVKLEIYTKTRGELLKITPKYTMKEREVEVAVKQKETVFGVYAGIGLETTTTLERLTPEVSLGIQNKRGDILTAKYGITDKSVGLSYSYRLINIKK